MRILLIQPAIEDFYSTPIRFYPLGLLYVAAVLQSRGHQVRILDSLTPLRKWERPIPAELAYLRPLFSNNPYLFQHYYRFGVKDVEIVRQAQAWQPDLIGISSQFTAYFQQTAELALALHHQVGCPIILGGHHASAFSAEIMEKLPFLQQVIVGPAETALFDDAKPRDSRPPEVVDWRSLRPAHELLSAEAYRIGKSNYVSLHASRGCPFKCDFCSVHHMFGDRISYRTVHSVIEEMRWNYLHKNVRIFNFEDDNLSWDRNWFLEFLRCVQTEPLFAHVELTAMNGLCHASLDEESLVEMRRAGFKTLNLSYVTRDEVLQKRYHRPNQQPLVDLLRKAQALDFFITVYVIIGLPGQTYDEIKESIDELAGLGVLVGPSVFYIPPGSALYSRLQMDDILRSQWSLYRSSAFAVETEHLTRGQLVELFAYARRVNLERRKR